MRPTRYLPLSLIALFATSHCAIAQSQSEEEELAASYGDKTIISIATGSQQSAAKAPSTATVITAKDIQAMGATDLAQVLESVPGLHVSRSAITNFRIFQFRGVVSGFSPEALILLDGMKQNTTHLGNRSAVEGTFPLNNVARIEIIRGPGSALYGADAFSGVINIITKTPNDVHGAEVGVRTGSFNSRDVWVQYGGTWGEVQTALYLRYGKSDVTGRIVDQDFQTFLDGLFQTKASLAPGPLNDDAKEVDAHANLFYKNWKLRFGYQHRKLGTYAGLGDALDPVGKPENSRYSLALEYQKNLAPNLDINAAYEHLHLIEPPANPHFQIFPPGAFAGAYPAGFIGNPGHRERKNSLHFGLSYTGIANHKFRFGLGYEKEDLYKTEEYKNFSYVKQKDGSFVLTPLGSIVNATGNPDLVFLLPQTRDLRFFYAQDEWTLTRDWTLTAGIRRDRYSDFGSTTNPRLALVWDAAYNLVIKVLYGQAFRAPSFAEQHDINNPTAIGNPAIRPEKIRTNEFGIVYQPSPSLQTNLTFFQYRQSNLIQFLTSSGSNGQAIAQNSGDQTGKGLEFETTWDASRNLRITGNYSYQKSIDSASGKDAGLVPQNRVFIRSDWRFSPGYQFETVLNYVADRKRQPTDLRPPIADYTTVDLSLRREKLFTNWDFQAAIKNLLDRDVREPTFTPGNIPHDLPQPGRSFYVQLQYNFQ